MQSCFVGSYSCSNKCPAASTQTVLPSKRQQASREIAFQSHRWIQGSARSTIQTAARITEEEDTLLWEPVSGRTSTEATGSGTTAESIGEQENDSCTEPEAQQGSQLSRSATWEQSLSTEEQAHMDEEAREFAYGFGTHQARDVLDGPISTEGGETEQEEAQATVPGAVLGKGGKGRKRNERRGGRPKDSSIPLHMLPKVMTTDSRSL